MSIRNRLKKLERIAEQQQIPWELLMDHVSKQMAASLVGEEFIPTPAELMPYRNNLLYSSREEHKKRCIYESD